MITHTLPIAADITITYNTVYIHTPDTTVNKFGKLLFCSSSVVHIYHIACQYIGQHLYEIKWTVLLTFRLWQGHNFVVDLGATSEVSRFSL